MVSDTKKCESLITSNQNINIGKKAYIPGPININEVQLDLVGSQWDTDRANRVIKEVNDELKRRGFTKLFLSNKKGVKNE